MSKKKLSIAEANRRADARVAKRNEDRRKQRAEAKRAKGSCVDMPVGTEVRLSDADEILSRVMTRVHIVEALIIAAENVDEVMQMFDSATSSRDFDKKFAARFHFSRKQTAAVLELSADKARDPKYIEGLRAECAGLGRDLERRAEQLHKQARADGHLVAPDLVTPYKQVIAKAKQKYGAAFAEPPPAPKPGFSALSDSEIQLLSEHLYTALCRSKMYWVSNGNMVAKDFVAKLSALNLAGNNVLADLHKWLLSTGYITVPSNDEAAAIEELGEMLVGVFQAVANEKKSAKPRGGATGNLDEVMDAEQDYVQVIAKIAALQADPPRRAMAPEEAAELLLDELAKSKHYRIQFFDRKEAIGGLAETLKDMPEKWCTEDLHNALLGNNLVGSFPDASAELQDTAVNELREILDRVFTNGKTTVSAEDVAAVERVMEDPVGKVLAAALGDISGLVSEQGKRIDELRGLAVGDLEKDLQPLWIYCNSLQAQVRTILEQVKKLATVVQTLNNSQADTDRILANTGTCEGCSSEEASAGEPEYVFLVDGKLVDGAVQPITKSRGVYLKPITVTDSTPCAYQYTVDGAEVALPAAGQKLVITTEELPRLGDALLDAQASQELIVTKRVTVETALSEYVSGKGACACENAPAAPCACFHPIGSGPTCKWCGLDKSTRV